MLFLVPQPQRMDRHAERDKAGDKQKQHRQSAGRMAGRVPAAAEKALCQQDDVCEQKIRRDFIENRMEPVAGVVRFLLFFCFMPPLPKKAFAPFGFYSIGTT